MKLINADCIEAMKAMPDNSVDSIVTDPPYELGFMGKSWDASGIAFNIEVWQEALRVIKPGGHLIAFSGSRTYHRMAVAIEDAGFQIRDQIMWVYGSGFPKSHNISKGIDKAAGAERDDAKHNGFTPFGAGSPRCTQCNKTKGSQDGNCRCVDNKSLAVTAAAQQWQGWGTALKPAHEPMVLARKPLEGTVANNVLKFGVGALNIDASRVEGKLEGNPDRFAKTTGTTFLSNPQEPPIVRSEGRFPANFIHDGSDEVVALFPDTKSPKTYLRSSKATANIDWNPKEADTEQLGFGDSGSAARFFYCAKASRRDRNEGLDGFDAKRDHDGRADGGVGGDNPRNRTNNAKLNHHPTVKPTTLMQYLVRLVTPPNGIVLDPFMGSGSTGKACAYEGFEFIGIDQSAEYVEIAQARIDFALADKSSELPL